MCKINFLESIAKHERNYQKPNILKKRPIKPKSSQKHEKLRTKNDCTFLTKIYIFLHKFKQKIITKYKAKSSI